MTEAEVQKKVDEAVKAATADLQKKLDEANETIKKMGAENAKNPQANDDDEDDAAKSKKFAEAVEAEVTKRLAKRDQDETFESEGVTIRKSEVGDNTFKILKSQAEKLEINEFTKRANETIRHLPGEEVVKAKALRALSKMDKDSREAIEAMLKSGNAALEQGMKEFGKGGAAEGSAEAELNKRTEAYAAEHKVDKYTAMAKFIETAEGRDLYKRYQTEKSGK